MKTVYLLYKFNAYRNRQIKRYETVAEYIAAAYDYDCPPNQKNFAYNDGVNTTMQIKQDPGAKYSPDYCLILDKDGNIESRWYVVESDKLMDTSYNLRLHRDLVADNFNEILNAPAFIEKATVNPADPFIFNQEQITVNQIKTSEKLLKDRSGCAWIVGYLPADGSIAKTINIVGNYNPDYTFASKAGFLQNFPRIANSKFTNGDPDLPSTYTAAKALDEFRIDVGWENEYNPKYHIFRAKWNPGTTISTSGNDPDSGYSTMNSLQTSANGNARITGTPYKNKKIFPSSFANTLTNIIQNNQANIEAMLKPIATNYFEDSPLTMYDGRIFAIEGKFYKANIKWISKTADWPLTQSGNTGTNAITSALSQADWKNIELQSGYDSIITYANAWEQYLEFTELTGVGTITLNGAEKVLNGIPYRAFAMPYNKDGQVGIYNNNTLQYNMSFETALQAANAISKAFTGANGLYDLQLLPYCPIQGLIKDSLQMNIPTDGNGYTEIIDNSSNKVGIIYWCTESTFSFDISEAIIVNNVKLESITDKHRLSSPNWNGQFEFNAAKNGGVSKFNVDCTYKPFTPYIHVNPNFGRLYGEDFDDARGLICSGDFSLPQVRDEWQTYELQNKNYQNQFDRQIENLELTQDVALKKQRIGAAVGAVSGAVSGAMTGAMVGGIPGAIAGGVLGGAASAAGAIADDYYTRLLNNETIDYSQDQFRMRNENIQALPDSLKQVGALTANNKLFPVLEYYTCTEEEKTAIALKLQYNGMTVERIGTIAEFIQQEETYIKAKLIRLNLEEDNHYLEALAQELNKGVFIKS